MDSGRPISSAVPFRAPGGAGGQVLLFTGGGGGFRSVGAPQPMAAAAGVENGRRKQPLFLAAHVEELQLELGPDVDDVVDQLCGYGQHDEVQQGTTPETRPNKRRLTAEQVRALEASFEEEKRMLEPERKSELARRLGMAPRQVAVWFQNRRARWRAKQLERDLDRLRTAHEEMLAGCDALVADNDRLRSQVTALTEKLQSKASPTSPPEEEHTAATETSTAMQAAVLLFQLDEAQLRETTGGAVPTLGFTGEANSASFESYFAGAPSPPLSSDGDCGDVDAMLLAAAAVEHGPGLAEEDVDSWEWFWS